VDRLSRITARALFGNVWGLKYSLKHLKHAVAYPEDYRIYDTSTWGYHFTEVKDGMIHTCVKDNAKGFDDVVLTVQEYWDNTKHRKGDICLISLKGQKARVPDV